MQRQCSDVDSNTAPKFSAGVAASSATTPTPPDNKKGIVLSHEKIQLEGSNLKDVLTLEHTDILCGRGTIINRHVGNIRFRRLIAANKATYNKCKKNAHKFLLALSIVVAIERNGGRFLKREDEKNENSPLIEINRKEAVSKITQALRDQLQSTNKALLRRKRKISEARAASEESVEDRIGDIDDDDNCSKNTSTSYEMSEGVLPLNHQAALQPLLGFSELMPSFCSSVAPDAPRTAPVQSRNNLESYRQAILRRQLYQQSRPLEATPGRSLNRTLAATTTNPTGQNDIWVPQELESLVLSDPSIAQALRSLKDESR